ncbi:MAG: hypothetical protein GY786_25420, partial [Proteobacteria bacterium]|nr:hypothetical protein [Pseudomonadota bacterium]
SLVYNTGKEIIYGLEMAGNAQYWERETDIHTIVVKKKTAEKLRIVVKMKGSMYFSEFAPQAPAK